LAFIIRIYHDTRSSECQKRSYIPPPPPSSTVFLVRHELCLHSPTIALYWSRTYHILLQFISPHYQQIFHSIHPPSSWSLFWCGVLRVIQRSLLQRSRAWVLQTYPSHLNLLALISFTLSCT